VVAWFFVKRTRQRVYWGEPGEPGESDAAEAQREDVAEFTWQPDGA
jgi:hypothetical protein